MNKLLTRMTRRMARWFGTLPHGQPLTHMDRLAIARRFDAHYDRS